MTASTPHEYSTRELSSETWPDFEKLFKKKGQVGDGWWCWCTYHHRESANSPAEKRSRTRDESAVRNHREQHQLVASGSSHGMIVYSDGEPIGWCQYGPGEELPRVESIRAYRKLDLGAPREKSWRITCFLVEDNHRRRGVASKALGAVLDAIKKKGGGLVEAYPVSQSDQGANYLYSGTVSMFEKAGFRTIASLGPGRTSRVVMQKAL